MKNLRIYCPLVNGSAMDFEYESGRHAIQELLTDDWGPPPTCLVIEARTADGRLVSISIPYDADSPAVASVE